MSYVVSAPGKVILFGEHSVVHNKPAIAAAVGLRTYALVEESQSGDIELVLADMKLTRSWKVDQIPFVGDEMPDHLDDELLAKIEPLLQGVDNTFQHVAATAFLYLYSAICTSTTTPKRFTVKSLLPLGSGLGSSASFSVCIASALLKLSNANMTFDTINAWAFVGEKCIHGNPSGIDNAVATQGGAVYFQRSPAKLEKLARFPPLKLLLIDTKVPRRTAALVAGVGDLVSRLPSVLNPLLDAMANLVDEAHTLLSSSSDANAAELSTRLGELARVNHGLLVAIGVSHPSLERIRSTSTVLNVGETKLTGAGGGGCAITIVTDADHAKIEQFKHQMPEFGVFETTLGAKGAGFVELAENVSGFLELKQEGFDALGEWSYW